MLIDIQDDFDLEKIAMSGQCFRVRKFQDGAYRFICGDEVLYIRETGTGSFSASCEPEQWENTWSAYFDLSRCYGDIRKRQSGLHGFVREAMDYGQGIRVLRQDPWETLVTFLISQRKSIPAIAKAVELLASIYGHSVQTERETLYAFPTPREMADATAEELAACGLGYRTPYILDAVHRAAEGLDLATLSGYDDEQLLHTLQTVRGVGKKVANCVALFAYGRTACVPVDVWISRAIEIDCGGRSPFGLFGENAGIIQQYVFYYEKHRPR